MQAYKAGNKTIFFIIGIAVVILAIYFGHTHLFKSEPTYNQVVNSKSGTNKTGYDGKAIVWQGKVSKHYSQITGIKFCIIDQEHQSVDINKPCDWFWASSKETMNADNTSINPSWNGQWVDYILNHYNATASKESEGGAYTITGTVDGIDCDVDDKCIPNIEIISIKNN